MLSPNGHVEHAFDGYDDGEASSPTPSPGRRAALVEFLDRMRFMMRVEVADVTADLAVTWRPAGRDEATPYSGYELVPRERLTAYAEAAGPAVASGRSRRCGSPAASRGSASTPTTARSPTRSAGSARRCTSTRAATAARRRSRGCTPSAARRAGWRCCTSTAPRTGCPAVAQRAQHGDKVVGFVGSSARHHELGPIALALVKRNVPLDATLEVDGMPAAQEVVVDPEVGLHVRPPCA